MTATIADTCSSPSPTDVHTLHNTHFIALPRPRDQVLYTVRAGSKWFDRQPHTLNLCMCNVGPNVPKEHHLTVGKGRVVYCQMMTFRDIPARIVEAEHDDQSRTYSTLLASMQRCYPGFSEDFPVTVMGYVRCDDHDAAAAATTDRECGV